MKKYVVIQMKEPIEKLNNTKINRLENVKTRKSEFLFFYHKTYLLF